MEDNFLTEKSLGKILDELFKDYTFVRQKPFGHYRADYCCDALKLIVEFDGIDHYQKSTVVQSDAAKDTMLTSLGYTVVRIPFFVQMSSEVIKNLFKIDVDFIQTFPHGFISKKAINMTPAHFCSLGLKRFVNDLHKFSYIKQDILNSLKDMAKTYHADFVYPLGSKEIFNDLVNQILYKFI